MTAALPLTTSAELLQALDELAPSDCIALDTEFMRESTYFPKLCLIQVASAGHCVLLDPLLLPDLTPFWQFLAERGRVKILHAARQDLEVVSLAVGGSLLPGPIFDTQVAAALLGLPAQIGYGSLVADRLGVSLPKGHTRTDWSRRPLSVDQLQYAADDVRYLVPLYHGLREELAAAGRLDWLYEETGELEQPDLHRTEPQLAWRRLKGLERLHPEQRATAKVLAQWRETAAIKHDKPRGWILADDALRAIAERLPGSMEDLERIPGLPPGSIRRRGTQLLELVEQGRTAADTEAAAFVPPRPDPQQLALVSKLMSFTRTRAEKLRISAETLATRRDVERLVFSGSADHLLQGWRREVIGEQLVALAGGSPGALPAA